MELSMNLPMDGGFVRRECPSCKRQFKWHHGPTPRRPEEAVDPEIYFCPYCGEPAPADDWWTTEQIEYAQELAAEPAMNAIAEEFKRSVGQGRNSLFQLSIKYDEPEPPSTLHEASDMVLVEPPCHDWEPLKIMDDWVSPVHCLICGASFTLE